MNATQKLAHQWMRTAGASDFENYGRGTDPKRIFQSLVEDARQESGHGGYSGTIAEKDGYKIRSRTPMSREQARKFVNDDIDSNDKWGPAYAIPVASTKVLSEKGYVVRIQAKTAQEARKLGLEAIAAKGKTRKGATVEVDIGGRDVRLLKAGGVPTLKTEKVTETYFKVGFSTYTDRKAAVLGAKSQLSANSANLGDSVLIEKIMTVGKITKVGEASRLPVWTVAGTRKQVSMGKIEGWYFYGMASS